MKNLIIRILVIALVTVVLSSPASAGVVTKKEALAVAESWINLTIQHNGDWGSSKIAKVEEIQELKRGNRIIGYFIRVDPQGFIVVSLRRELAPVKAYSTVSYMDPESNEGFSDLIKGGVERVLKDVEKKVGPVESAKSADVKKVLEIDYSSAWDELEAYGGNASGPNRSAQTMNYRGGDVMLSSNWRQGDPYNRQTPAIAGSNGCPHAVVGCVATAGAQLMRYWDWPPYGVGDPYYNNYDWPNMPDIATASSPQIQIDAVARLSYEAGKAVDMDYGCSLSGAYVSCWWAGCRSLEDALKDTFRYNLGMNTQDRSSYDAVSWFELLKSEFNKNQPVIYALVSGAHAIVADGWQEIGSTPIRQYHLNYGWGDGNTTWWTLDELYLGDPGMDYVIPDIAPVQSTGSILSGTYPLTSSFPYRYFNVDAAGGSAAFEAGQYLQFLPHIRVTGISTTGDAVSFYGTSYANTRLFTRGDTSKGVRIYNGAIKLRDSGSIAFS